MKENINFQQLNFFKKFLLFINLFDKKLKILIFFGFFLSIVAALIEMVGIILIIPLINLMIDTNVDNAIILKIYELFEFFSIVKEDKKKIILILFLFFCFFLLFKLLLTSYIIWFNQKLSALLRKSLSNKILSIYFHVPLQLFYKKGQSHITTYVGSNSRDVVSSLILPTIGIALDLLIIISITSIILYYNFAATFYAALILCVCFFIYSKISNKKLKIWGKKQLESQIELNKILHQSIYGVKEIRVSNSQNKFLNFFSNYLDKLQKFIVLKNFVTQISKNFFEFFLSISLFFFLYFSFYYTNLSLKEITVNLSIILISSMRIIPSLNKSLNHFQAISFGTHMASKVYEEINTLKKYLNQNHESKESLFIKENDCDLNLQNLFFKYEDKEKTNISDISANLGKKGLIGIIGENGSGKSTLIDLISGLLEPTRGDIKFGNKSIYKNKHEWQKKIGYIGQSTIIFDNSIIENITFSKENLSKSEYERIRELLKDVNLLDYVNSLKEGLETNIGTYGANLSGGERQKISIVRALFSNPSIIIIDEGTNQIDKESENKILRNLLKISDKKLIILIIHNQEIMKLCDKLIYLEKGKLVDFGISSEIIKLYNNKNQNV